MFDNLTRVKSKVKYKATNDPAIENEMIEFEHLIHLYNHQPTPDRYADLEAKAMVLNRMFEASERNK